uniref:Uncharacterized protein n=1 Tax=viral metagenome TaxID=1070528 RepID=A0A6C0AP96_9ZZZZ
MPSNSNWFLQFFNDEPDNYIYKKDNCKPLEIPKIFINRVYLINGSNGAVTDAQCDTMVEALNIQLQSFCDDWSVKPVILARSESPPPGSYQIILTSDTQYTIPGVYGYHMHPLADGTVKAYVCVNVILPAQNPPPGAILAINPNGVLYPTSALGASVSRVVSHELLEMIINPGLNKLYEADVSNLLIRPKDPNGNDIVSGVFQFCAEVGDAVNQQSYTIITSDSTKVQVSDYVMPSWFSVFGKAPFNYNNTLQGPLTLSSGGYYSRENSSGTFSIEYKK